MKLFKISFLAILAVSLFTFGCGDDEGSGPDALGIVSIEAAGTDLMSGNAVTLDLNGAAAATDVPLDATITVTFDVPVTNASATANVKLTLGGADVSSTVTHTGAAVRVDPDLLFQRGAVYTLEIGAVEGEGGETFTAVTRSFTTAGRADVVPPQEANQLNHWPLNGNANSADGAQNGVEYSMGYGPDRFGSIGSAATFDGDVSLIEIPDGDGLINESMTISYWVWVDTLDHLNAGGGKAGHFVMGVGDVYGFFVEVGGTAQTMKFTGRYQRDDGTTSANDFFVNADGKDGMNGGWVGVEFEKDLTAEGGLASRLARQWAHVVIVYDAAAKKRHLYINSELIETDNFNLTTGLLNITGLTFDDSDAGTDVIGKALALGFNHDIETTHWDTEPWGGYDFPTSNHFKGMLDDLRIWDVPLNSTEVTELYDAEKP